MRLLYIEDEPFFHRKSSGSIDSLSPEVRGFCDVVSSSQQKNLFFTVLQEGKKIHAVFIDTHTFLINQMIVPFLKKKVK